MPIYEYMCRKCGKRFEILWNDPFSIPLTWPCPEEGCDGKGDKIYSNFSIGKAYNEPSYLPSNKRLAFLLIGPFLIDSES